VIQRWRIMLRDSLGRFHNVATAGRVRRQLLATLTAAALLAGTGQPVAFGAGLPAGQSAAQADSAAAGEALTATLPSVYWGAFVPGWPSSPAAIDTFEHLAGKSMSVVGWGASWWQNGNYVPFQTDYFQTIRSRGSIPMLSWGSWDFCCALDQPKFQLSAIARGDHDAFLVKWARSARAWGHPFFLNFDSEMNGWWWPWSEEANGNGKGDFIKAWRHVVDLFRREGVTNATFVWCPNIVVQGATPLEDLYPGDNYVDWTCFDGYNWGTDKGNVWLDPAQIFGSSDYYGGINTYDSLINLAPSKPIMIGETASTEDGGSKADWITNAFTLALPHNFPQIRAVMWYAWADDSPDVHWGINTSPEAQEAFAAAIALPRYAPNLYADFGESPIQPPDGPFVGSISN